MPHEQLFQNIFKTGLQDYGAGNQLQKVTEEYPYFSLAYFFKLKREGMANENLAAITNLHFNNPFLLNYQLNRELTKKITTENEQPIHFPESVEEEQMNTQAEMTSPAYDKLSEEDEIQEQAAAENEEKKIEQEENLMSNPQEDIPVVPGAVQHFFASHPPAENLQEQSPQPVLEESHSEIPQKTEESGKLPQEWLFEPLHTTDYFASQGIKLQDDPQPGDKLGKQLKSFTEWLKTMKKLHESKPAGDVPLDVSVQNMAEKSNVEEEILTETMAEAFVQQGKAGKAVEVYEKLSLLNPAKSAFFAAKIENLKGI